MANTNHKHKPLEDLGLPPKKNLHNHIEFGAKMLSRFSLGQQFRFTEKHRCSTNLASHFSQSEFQIGQLSSLLPSYSSNCPLHLSKVMLGYVKITRCTQIIYPRTLTCRWKIIHFDNTYPERWWGFYGYHCFLRGYRIYRRYYQDGKSRKKLFASYPGFCDGLFPRFSPNTPFYTPQTTKHVS